MAFDDVKGSDQSIKTIFWFFLGSTALFLVVLMGQAPPEDSPTNDVLSGLAMTLEQGLGALMFTLFFAMVAMLVMSIVIFVPAAIVKKHRNWQGFLRVIRGVGITWVALVLLAILSGEINSYFRDRQQGADVGLTAPADTIRVIHTTEENAAFMGKQPSIDAVEALKIKFEGTVIRTFKEQLRDSGYSTDGAPELSSVVGLTEMYGTTLGLVSTIVEMPTDEGLSRTKYLMIVGIQSSTLHRIICYQTDSVDLDLTNKRCLSKVNEIFSEAKVAGI
jgi:hypothetical protein